MTRDLPLRCTCGTVQGSADDVSPDVGNHVVCYCVDCQAFATYLGTPGITDDAGGTPIFQMPRSQIRITAGLDQLCCVRLSPKGLHRWYASCCKTPIGNTLDAGMPFIGLIDTCIDRPAPERTELLGKATGIHAAQAKGKAPNGAHPKIPIAYLLRAAPKFAKWLVLRKGSPSPFFDDTGKPRVTPRILSKEERNALR